jgi:hypothetical protein
MNNKMKRYIKLSLLAATVLAVITSCLEDRGYTDIIESANNTPTISFFGGQNGLSPFAVPVSTAEKVSIKVTGGRLEKDVTVKLRLNPSVIPEHNIQYTNDRIKAGDTLNNGLPDFTKIKLYDILPDSVFTLPSLEITVPKDSKDGEFVFTVNSSKMSLTGKYLLPFYIESVSDPNVQIANNLRSVSLFIQVKNKYDGVYSYTGQIYRYAADGTPLNDGLDGTVVAGVTRDLITNGASSVLLSPLWAPAASGIAGIGSPVIITVDPVSNNVTLSPSIPPAAANWGAIIGERNYYDPATKKIYLNWKWGGGSSSPITTTRGFRLVLEYKNVRK